MLETQKIERLRFTKSPPDAIFGRKATELDQASLFRVKFQTELRQPVPELIQEPDGFGSMLKADVFRY